jgi:hypothetical protein
MADTGKDKDTKPVYDAELPADEEFEEEPEETAKSTKAEAPAGEAPARPASSGLRGRFGFGRGSGKSPAG